MSKFAIGPELNIGFAEALELLKIHAAVQREKWNDKGVYLVYFSAAEHGYADKFNVRGIELPLLPFIMMKTMDNMWIPWSPSPVDMMAEDWQRVQLISPESI